MSTHDTSITYYLERDQRFPYIYTTLVMCIAIMFSALPIIYVDVSINCSGTLRPSSEIASIRAVGDGIITEVLVVENQKVQQGQPMFYIRSKALDERALLVHQKYNDNLSLRQDASSLIKQFRSGSGQIPPSQISLETDFYRQVLADYKQKLNDHKERRRKVRADFERSKILYESGVIAATEMEEAAYEMTKASNEINSFNQSTLVDWQQQLLKYKQELADGQSQLNQLKHEQMALQIIAPVTGAVQQLIGAYPGSHVTSNQELAHISPDTPLVAEIYVTPEQIGILRRQMKVRITVASFNYNQWGFLDGEILRISEDVVVARDKPFFRVVCVIQKRYLELKNGYRGLLRKGMSVQARFLINKRSLWELLFDKVDDWINPNL